MRGGVAARAVIVGVVLAVLIGGAFAFLLIAIENLSEAGRGSNEARQSHTAADALQASTIDLETGERGFVITDEERFLQPWHDARRAIPAQEKNLIDLAQSPTQKTESQDLANQINAYIRDYSVPVVRAVRQGDPSAKSVATTLEGKHLGDRIRARFDRLEAGERALVTRREGQADDDANRAVALGAAGLAGSVLLILLAGVGVVRSIVLPIRRTSAMAARLAQGELDVRLPETGMSEIGALERSFNRMGASLELSTAELRASRARVVAGVDEMRRRIKRDLHDGAQQSLVRTVISLKLARRELPDDSEGAKLVDEALRYAEQANGELRELAHGILPAVLTRGGLRAGVESLASRVPLPVSLDILEQRLPQALEATAYFITAESLTNVVKHARAGRAQVCARLERDVLRLEVEDDGVGGADLNHGSGLMGLKDRAAAAGGELRVESHQGSGTTIIATLPVTGDSPERDGSAPSQETTQRGAG